MKHLCTTAAAALLILTGCAGSSSTSTKPAAGVQLPSATAQLRPTQGHQARGTVRFTQKGDQVHIEGEVTGLQARSVHGFHVNESRDCSSGDGKSADEHFNPHNAVHGMAMGVENHTGDLPSLMADANGTARIDVKISGPRVGSGADDIVGRSLIVDEDRDDFLSQPAGDAGAAIACGVIIRG